MYVASLPEKYNKEQLRDEFKRFGEVIDCFVVNRDNFSFGFVTYGSHAEAQDAIDDMNMNNIGGRTIKCSKARPRPGGPRGQAG